MNRQEVYKIIDEERVHQDSIGGSMNHQGNPTVEATLLMMEHYLAEARNKWVNGDSNAALEMMRKVVGIGVRCFENHGCPRRKLPKKNVKSTIYDIPVKYELTKKERKSILKSMEDEFKITQWVDSDHSNHVIFSHRNVDFFDCSNINSLFTCSPPMSNVRYLVRQAGCVFENGNTDKLCREIHNKHVMSKI